MTDELKSSLYLITNPKEAKQGELVAALQILDNYVNTSNAEMHPRLLHFLQKRSYQKAWTWLHGGKPEKGICGK